MSLSNASQLAGLATTLKGLHIPGKPLLVANVHDHLSATAVASLPATKALATASYAVALAAGTEDDDLSLEENLAAAKHVGAVALKHNLPASVDSQDGYGDRLEEGIRGLLERGIVGINLEDYSRDHESCYTIDENCKRIKTVISTAEELGVQDFVVNARCDVLVHGGSMDETIVRGKAYLDAGATCVFVWGGSQRGVSSQEIKTLVKDFGGKLNVSLKLYAGGERGLKIQEIAKLGVSRVSVGPAVMFKAQEEWKRVAGEIVEGKA